MMMRRRGHDSGHDSLELHDGLVKNLKKYADDCKRAAVVAKLYPSISKYSNDLPCVMSSLYA